MTKYVFLLFILVGLSINNAFAVPDPQLRVIVLDYSAGTAGSGMTFSVTPTTGFIARIDNTGEIQIAERIAVYNGDVYAANGPKISKLNLDSAGFTTPPFPGDNADDVTGPLFSSLGGIAIDSNGIIYVADNNQQIYPVDLNNIPTSTPAPLPMQFNDIRHITIYNDILYVLDIGTDSIFQIDLTQNTLQKIKVYSGSSAISLSNANSIAVIGNDIYVSGSFNFDGGSGPGVIKITDNTPFVFTRQLTDPTGLAIANGDLYVADQGANPSSLFRFSLSDPSTRVTVVSEQLNSPADLSILKVEELSEPAIMKITKSANVDSVMPGDEIIYTLKATNTGPGQATSVIIHDYFPNTLTGHVESVSESGNLFFTSKVNRNGVITDEGSCEREGGNLYVVICNGYSPLEVGDYIEITLKGHVNPLSSGTLVNRAVVDNLGAINDATVSTNVINSVTLSVTKSVIPNQATAGLDSVQYTIRVANDASNSPSANNVIITDDLPAGSTSVTIQSEPSPATCTILPNNDSPTQLRCGPYTLLVNQFVEINYTIEVGSDAQNPFTNNLNVTCDQCTSVQTDDTTIQIIRNSALSITKQADKSSVIAGADSILYTLAVKNNGPSDAANVVVTDNLPQGVSFNEAETSQECSYSEENHQVTCSLLSLPVNTEKTFVINVDVRSSATDSLINTASVTSDSMNSDDTSEPIEIDVQTQADITIIKTAPQNTVAGRTITYTLNVTNSGPSDAVAVVASDEIPFGLLFIPNSSNPQTDPNCNINAGTVFCNFDTIVAGTTETKSFLVKIPLELIGTIKNTADVITETQDTDPDNNISTVTTIINPPFCGRAESDFNVIYGTEGNDHIKGTNDDDLIFGLGGNDKIHGKRGNDCIIGGDGNDKIWGGDGNDFIEGNAGNDQLHGQKGNDTLIGGDGDDKIFGGQGDDTIDAGTGDDRIHGNQGNDIIVGGDGNDWIGAGIDNDTVNGGAGNDKIFGRPGNDILNGEAGDDYIHGGQGDDTVTGGDGKDKIFGHQGHDTLNGDSGDDTIHGGQGNDYIDGGADTDRCNGAQGNNTIINCEIDDKKMKEENEENDDDEGESESDDN